jgi:glucosamine-6-phosphate deaminase
MNFPEKEKRFEKIPTRVFKQSQEASKLVAAAIAKLIREKNSRGEKTVLGLATGSSPVSCYDELVRLHKEEGLSFKNVVTFNLDEYYPMEPGSLQSYVRFMRENLFDHIDIPEENIHIPDGTIAEEDLPAYCVEYENKIQANGGIDIQVLGIGRSGHIGFNEPGSWISSRTRLITLDKITRRDAASDFFSEENVPRRAITMGIGTILDARKVYLMAWGEGKANVIKEAIEGQISDLIPASYLQKHKDVEFFLDEAAAAELSRFKAPWLVGQCEWTPDLRRKAVVWLCQHLNKPILKLTDVDYNEYGMSDLITAQGPAYQINIQIFNELQHTITGWPGGKPNADDSQRPERAKPFPKRSLIFSPHPDDDVISMGGTLIRLVDQGNEVHVAYQTSGNIAVFDDDALRFLDFVVDFNREMEEPNPEISSLFNELRDFMEAKTPGQVDTLEMQKIKGLIRRGEAKSACRYSGVNMENVYFLDMPFYETGRVKKKPLGEKDIQIIVDLLQKVKPHQIYAAGDLSDPHGTHRVCLSAVLEAVNRLKDEEWTKDCYIWLYRGAWQEWEIDKIEMAVPLSPIELARKRRAIFKHQSQKDRPLFPGSDNREFWQRAEDRNKGTAMMYDKLGLPEYEAMEAFVRWKL